MKKKGFFLYVAGGFYHTMFLFKNVISINISIYKPYLHKPIFFLSFFSTWISSNTLLLEIIETFIIQLFINVAVCLVLSHSDLAGWLVVHVQTDYWLSIPGTLQLRFCKYNLLLITITRLWYYKREIFAA